VKKTLRWQIAQHLEVKWWQRYLSDKDPEAYLSWKKEYWKDLLRDLSCSLPVKPGDRVLDAGCGPAGIFIALDQQVVIAVDPLLDAYGHLDHFRPDRYPDVAFVTSSLEQYQAEQPFDVVFCLNAINHVADIHLAYDRLAAAVKRGGYLVVSIDAHKHGLLKHTFRLFPGDALHPHQYNLEEYTGFLKARGFTIEQTLLKTPGKIFDYYVQVARKPG